MAGLRERLQWTASHGSVTDGPRRYLLMRPDVLMGAAARLDADARRALFDAWAESTAQHGGDSLRAYAAMAPGDADALLSATAAAAADLGWGRWTWQRDADGLALQVDGSPFVQGWRAAAGGPSSEPVCAPVRGMFSALLAQVQPGSRAVESHCAARHAAGEPICRFSSRQRA
jgi:uncharacterized protein